ncbi:hypothetical protein U9M48_033059 [Paspalum notatum var. saurae]|uniref:Uncharacterized protein n=1 Tax=Paspalum notatum var. saurae TaxID=547442 RepID=A0AAQ3X5N7_PASNO
MPSLLSSPAQVWRCVERVVQFAIASLDGRATVCIATDQKSSNWEEEKLALAVRNELSIKWYQAYRLSSIDGVTCRMFPWRETVGLPIRVKLGRFV